MCNVCSSSKGALISVGFMGVGFKSVFKVFQRAEVHTRNGLRFVLDIRGERGLAGSTLPQQLPNPTNDKFPHLPSALAWADWWQTAFVLSAPCVPNPLESSLVVPPHVSLHSLSADKVNAVDSDRLLLFLANLHMRGLNEFSWQGLEFGISSHGSDGNSSVRNIAVSVPSNFTAKPILCIEVDLCRVLRDHWRSWCKLRRLDDSVCSLSSLLSRSGLLTTSNTIKYQDATAE